MKRFGLVADDEMSKDLVAEINKEIGGALIKKVYANATGATTTWYSVPPTGVSYYEHKQTFKDMLAQVESVLLGNSQRGTISVIIAGKDVCAVIQTLPGFIKLTDGNTLGAHVFGTLDGVTVIRVAEAAIMPALEAIAIWSGVSAFECAATYAPFMPLVVTSTLPRTPNPLTNIKAAAVWAGIDVVVPQFIAKFVISNTVAP